MSDWRDMLVAEWERQHVWPKAEYPLMGRALEPEDIRAAAESLVTGQLTMGDRVRAFEQRFAQTVGAPFAVMVNSGSSANLLAIAAVTNPARSRRLEAGDEVLVPAVAWSTTIWPLVQYGLRPVLVDVDRSTINLSIENARRRLTSKTRAIVTIHVLGNSSPMRDLLAFCEEHDLLLIEDTCESLSSRAQDRWLGTFGAFGTFSFYYSHHVTTGEGGMVVCKSQEDYDLLKCLRAHGWSRELSNRADVEAKHADIDPRFLFVNAGYNLRPTEIQAALGDSQFNRIASMANARRVNRANVIDAMQQHAAWSDQFEFATAAEGTEPVWFGLTLLINGGRDRASFLAALTARGVENRPILSGNFARQPGLALFGIDVDPRAYPGAEEIHERGFFIGLQSSVMSAESVQRLASILLTT